MGRRLRVNVAEGIYYVVQHGSSRCTIFSQPEDYALFEKLLADSLRLAGARVHGYCWMPSTIHLILQIDETSVGRIMQNLTSRYARPINQRMRQSGHFFPKRYRAALIDPNDYLLRLLRYLHYLPVLGGLAESLGDAVHTSHAAYLRQSASRWLTIQTAGQLFDQAQPNISYRQFMELGVHADDIDSFERVGAGDVSVIGGSAFQKTLPWRLRTHRSQTSLDQVVHTVTCRMGVEREHVLSGSQQRDHTLVRALIAWYATERGVATLTEVARYLGRDPSTLSSAISRHRQNRPELFRITAMHDITPIVPIKSLPENHFWNATPRTRPA